MIPGLGGDNDLGLYPTVCRHRRRPSPVWLALKLAAGLVAAAVLLGGSVLCGVLGFANLPLN